jgi:protein ImuB
MLWLALHLPQLSLEAFCATLADQAHARPVVLLAAHRVSHLNAVAAERGIRVGARRATALALAADLLVADSHAQRDAAALLAVAHAALAFTPMVSLHDAQTVLLDVQSSLRLFGGLPRLVAQLRSALAPLGHPVPHRVQMAAAPTALGAALLAQGAAAGRMDLTRGAHVTQPRPFEALIDDVPVWLLGPGGEHWEALQGMGLQRLSDLRRLPRAGLARRFGPGLLDDLDRALGARPDPRQALELPASFEARLELQMRADTTEQVLAGAAVLLARLVAWAQGRHSRIAAFTLVMLHETRHETRRQQADQPATELRIEMAEPALDAAHLQGLLRERLARCELAAPTLELRLHCRHLVAAAAPNAELFPTRHGEAEGLTRLLERLRARLGDEHVQRLQPVADHRPEHASRSVALQIGVELHDVQNELTKRMPTTVTPTPTPSAALPLHHPAWLLREPVPLAERAAVPWLDGQPLQLVSGPERIEAGWWDGGTPAVRDYFIARTADGSLVSVWRGRLPSAEPSDVAWWLQGRFG